MEQLRAVRALALPDWCIAAGFVRNRVWDHLHGIVPARTPADIDVLYYDAADLSKEREFEFEDRLDDLLPGLPWQVRNQARMHVWKGLPQHKSTSDAMTYWLETVTAVGVRLEDRRVDHRDRATRGRRPARPGLSADRIRPHAAQRLRRPHRPEALARAVAEGSVSGLTILPDRGPPARSKLLRRAGGPQSRKMLTSPPASQPSPSRAERRGGRDAASRRLRRPAAYR